MATAAAVAVVVAVVDVAEGKTEVMAMEDNLSVSINVSKLGLNELSSRC